MLAAAAHEAFVTFSASHWAAIGATAAAAVGLPLIARRAKSPALTRAIAWGIAGALVANELVYYAHGLATVSPYEFIRDKLPLHICGIAVYLIAGVLVLGRGRRAFEVAYFWGLGGTAQAILTPNLLEGWPSYRFVQFFITHGGIVAGVLYAVLALGMRPGRGAVLRIFLISNLALALTAGFNALVGSNYMFLCEPPPGASPFFFLPWPWYLAFLEALGLAFLVLLDLPFALARRRDGANRHLTPPPSGPP